MQIIGLHLENTNITDASLGAVLRYSPSVRVLDVSKCAQLSEKGLLSIVENCSGLRYLGMRDMMAVTDSVVSCALSLPQLLRLDIDGAPRLTEYLVSGHRGASLGAEHSVGALTHTQGRHNQTHSSLSASTGATSCFSTSSASSSSSYAPHTVATRASSLSFSRLASPSSSHTRSDSPSPNVPVFELPVALATPTSTPNSTNYMKSDSSGLRINASYTPVSQYQHNNGEAPQNGTTRPVHHNANPASAAAAFAPPYAQPAPSHPRSTLRSSAPSGVANNITTQTVHEGTAPSHGSALTIHTPTHVSGALPHAPLPRSSGSSWLRSARSLTPMHISPLEEVSACGLALSARALSGLFSHCPRLTSLNLSYCTQINDAALQDIILSCPLLDSLTLRQTTNLTDAFLPAVAGLETLQLLENPQLTLPAIRKLVTSEEARVHVVGTEIDITFLRNSLTRVPFTVTINEYEPAQSLLLRIEDRLKEEGVNIEPVEANENMNFEEGMAAARRSAYKLRKVTYRKNGTKRPGQAHPETEYANLVRELVEKKHHVYLDQNPNSALRLPNGGGAGNDLFLTLRVWDANTGRPRDLRDVSLPSTLTLADLKRQLHAEGSLSAAPEQMFVVEEETDLRTNILATDAMSISMCGIISGDILHFEEIAEDKLDAHTQQIVHSCTGNFLSSRPVLLSIQETDESFHRRRGKLTFLQESAFKFELKLKNGWSFAKLKNRIARKVGVAAEHLRLSTRVEPQAHLQGSGTQPAVDAIGGNLWLLLDIDCAEMLTEKIPIVIHHYNRAGNCASVQTILVKKTATLKQLKEKLNETLRIPEELQLISRLSSREVAAAGLNSVSVANAMALNAQNVNFAMQSPLFVRQVYLQNSLKLNQLNLHHIRVDEMERPVLESDLILQTVQFAGWKSNGFKSSAATIGPVRLIALPAGSKFNEIKASIASNHSEMIDIDTMALKLASSTSLQRALMFDIRPKYYQDHSPVLASTLMRPLDIVCWNDIEF